MKDLIAKFRPLLAALTILALSVGMCGEHKRVSGAIAEQATIAVQIAVLQKADKAQDAALRDDAMQMQAARDMAGQQALVIAELQKRGFVAPQAVHVGPGGKLRFGVTGDNPQNVTITGAGMNLAGLKVLSMANGSASSDGAAFGQIAATTLNSFAAPTASVSFGSQKGVLVADGTGAQDICAFHQVNDAILAGKASTVDAVLNTNQATMTGFAQTVDGVAADTTAKRICLFGQSTPTQDGCYNPAAGAWTRTTDLPVGTDASLRAFTARSGTANKGTWAFSNAVGAGIVGTNDLAAVPPPAGGGGVSSVNGQTGAVVLTASDVSATLSTSVVASTTVALPANTYANGTLGVGATMTANANGAFPTIDGITVGVGEKFLNQHGGVENGVYTLTSAGSGGSAWLATRDVSLDTAAEVQRSRVSCSGGIQHIGAAYIYKAKATVVMGTTVLFWKRTDSRISLNEGRRVREDFIQTIHPATNATWGSGLQNVVVTTANAFTNVNDGIHHGVERISRGTTATFFGGIQDAWTVSGAAPDGGGSFTFSANVDVEIDFGFQIPTLPTAGQDFAIALGLAKERVAGQKIATNGAQVLIDRTSGVSAANFLFAVTTGGTGTPSDSGVPVVAATYYRAHISHDAGAADWRFSISGGAETSISSNSPTGIVLGLQGIGYGTVGTTSVAMLDLDYVDYELGFPQGRFN